MKPDIRTVSSSGRIVIPAKLRRKYGIGKGTRVSFLPNEHNFVVQPLTSEYIRSLCGSIKTSSSALKYLLKERTKDRVL